MAHSTGWMGKLGKKDTEAATIQMHERVGKKSKSIDNIIVICPDAETHWYELELVGDVLEANKIRSIDMFC